MIENSILNVKDNYSIKSDKTEYFSATSQPLILDINNDKSSILSEIKIKKKNEENSSFQDLSNDSFDSFVDNNYNLDHEYELMKEYLKNGEYDKIRE
jgi:hypothetical protein